jgi:hypothetical protein
VHYQYESGGEVVNTLETSVNKPCTPSKDAEKITRVAKIRVETHIVEDKTVENGKVYEKRINTLQLRDDAAAPSSGRVSESSRKQSDQPSYDQDEKEQPAGRMGRFEVLKNLVDNIAKQGRLTQVFSILALVVAFVAVVVAVIGAAA